MAGIPHLRPTEASLREVRQALQQVELALSSTPLHNWTATSDPTAGDDLRDGYGQGSWWYRTDTEGLWICTDASPGNAVWDDTVGSTILGAATAFKTINCPAGTDPVSEVAADTLHLYSGHAGLTITGDSSADSVTYNLVEGSIDHDSLQNFVGDKHVAHSGVTLTAGAGLTGGGTIAANRTFDLDVSDLDAIAVPAAADQLAIYDDGVGQKKITFANLESNISHDAIADVSADDHHAEIHTIVSHDTTATGANLTTLTDGSDAAGLHTHGEDDIHDLGTTVLLHSLFDAHTILYATADNTPLALTVAEDSVIGRTLGGNINALTEGTLPDPGGPAAGDYVLGWKSGVLVKWATTSLGPYVHPNHSGDVTSTGDGATVVAALQGETLTITAGAAGDYLRYSGAAWVDVASSQILTDIEASIDHTAITNIGATSHADIDTHIGIALTAAATIDQHQLIVGASDGTRQMAATQLEWTTYGAGAGGTYSGYFHMAGQIVLWLSTDTTPAQLDYAALLTGDGDATLLATGSSANVNLLLQAKGSGVVTANNDGTDREVATISGTQTLTNKTLTTPTIGDFTNATHNHQNEAGGRTLSLGEAHIDLLSVHTEVSF